MHQKRSIFIGRVKLKENMDCVVGHATPSFARSDGAYLIAERTADIFRAKYPYKNRCSSLCNLTCELVVKQLSDF